MEHTQIADTWPSTARQDDQARIYFEQELGKLGITRQDVTVLQCKGSVTVACVAGDEESYMA